MGELCPCVKDSKVLKVSSVNPNANESLPLI